MFSKSGHSSDILRGLMATLCFGATGGIFQLTINNYLAEVHHFEAEARGWLEFPRGLPGFLLIFVRQGPRFEYNAQCVHETEGGTVYSNEEIIVFRTPWTPEGWA